MDTKAPPPLVVIILFPLKLSADINPKVPQAWFLYLDPRASAASSIIGIGGLTSVTGGTFPAKIWTAFMKGALKGQEVMDFPAPSNIGGLDPVVMTSGGTQSRTP